MSRRYLTLTEAKSALSRNKEIEMFLGGFELASEKCIRWVSFVSKNDQIIGKVWEAIDEGSKDFLDIYSFSPASGEWDEPVQIVYAKNLEAVLRELKLDDTKLVNSGVAQDEYATYLSTST